MEATRFLLIRHAESTWSSSGRWQGQGDPPLSEHGRHQAARLAERLGAEPVDVLVCSDLRRCRETADAIGTALGLEAQPSALVRELDVGSWTGLTRGEIEERDPETLQRFEQEDPDVRPGGGETRREIRLRTRGAIEALAAAHPGKRIALVAHLGVIRALLPGSEPEHIEVKQVSIEQIREAIARRA